MEKITKALLISFLSLNLFYACGLSDYDYCDAKPNLFKEKKKKLSCSTKSNLRNFFKKYQYVYLKPLGKGVYANVHLIQAFSPWNKQMALKERLKGDKCNTIEAISVESFRKEAKALKLTNHPGIPKLYLASNDYILMDYINAINLDEFLKDYKKTNKPSQILRDALNIGLQLVEIIEYLHEEINLIHGDIHLENILIDKNKHVSLIDFGDAIGYQKNSSYNLQNLKRSDILAVSNIISDILSTDQGSYYVWVPEPFKALLCKPFNQAQDKINHAKSFKKDLKDFAQSQYSVEF